jgi:hypothetical protein
LKSKRDVIAVTGAMERRSGIFSVFHKLIRFPSDSHLSRSPGVAPLTSWPSSVRRLAKENLPYLANAGLKPYDLWGQRKRQLLWKQRMSFGSSCDRYSFRVNTEGIKGRVKIGEDISIARGFSEDLLTNPIGICCACFRLFLCMILPTRWFWLRR